MNGEVQLIVRPVQTLTLTSQSNTAIYGSVGSWRLIIESFPEELELDGKTLTLINANGDTQACVVDSIVQNSPSPGYTRLNFLNTNPFNFDFTLAAGGYFLYDVTKEYYLDLFVNESISQNWRFQDLNNFTSQGAFTREFRVPFSDTNQLAVGALFDVNVSAGDMNFFHYKLPAEIRVDTLPISFGYVRVRKVYKQNNRINEVELAFYAETPDLVRNIGEKKLKDIVDLPNLNQNMTYDNISTPTIPGVWTVLERGQLWSAGNQQGTRPIDSNTSPIYAGDFTPALGWNYLFEEIITDAGFELEAGTLLGTISEYHMPWLNSQRPVASDSFNDLLFQAETSTPMTVNVTSAYFVLEADTEIFDNGGDYNPATFTYTTPSEGYYTFQAVLQLSPSLAGNAEIPIQVGLIVDGIVIPGLAFATILQNFPNSSERIFTFRIGIDAASTVQFVIFNTLIGIQMFDVMGSWSLIGLELKYGQTFFFDLNAPDIKQIDFVTDVLKMHNCAIVSDRTRPNRVQIVPQNSYLGSGNLLDWTSKLDTSKDITISSTVDLQKAKFQFTYSAGEDNLSKVYKNVNRVYGDYEVVGYTVNPDVESSDFAIGDQSIKLVTQSTPCAPVNGTDIIMPMFINEQLQFVNPGMRCLYYAGNFNGFVYDDGTATVVQVGIRLLNHYSAINPDIYDFDLNWAPEVPPYGITTNPYNNLFNLYWRTYMNALYSPDARIMEASFALDLKDILTFQFSDKIWIENCYWRILEINDYKVGMQESTSVKLIKFLEDVEDCSATPSTISVGGEVNFVDSNGDPVDATQDCCTRYGYNWDESTAICWATIPSDGRPNTNVGGTTTNPAPRVTKTAQQTRSIINSVINGDSVTIEIGNRDMLAVGNTLELYKNVQGSNLLGKNVYTNLPGMHLGGGFRDGSIYIEKGWAQSGTVILHRKDAYPAAGNAFYYIEGITNEHIELPNDTLWSCLLNVTVWDTNAATYATGQYSFAMTKIAGVAAVSAITALNTVNTTAFTFTVGVNVAVPAKHRLFLNVGGGGTFPVDIITTASLQYQQSKIS
jgi:hypothetical protein